MKACSYLALRDNGSLGEFDRSLPSSAFQLRRLQFQWQRGFTLDAMKHQGDASIAICKLSLKLSVGEATMVVRG